MISLLMTVCVITNHVLVIYIKDVLIVSPSLTNSLWMSDLYNKMSAQNI